MKPPLLTIGDLLPSAKDLQQVAYGSTSGDPAMRSFGIHGRRNPDRRDAEGLSKRLIQNQAQLLDFDKGVAFFDAFAARAWADPFQIPPSWRSLVQKDELDPSKGTRPIDDPCEFKRLLLLHVRRLLDARIEANLTTGQYGGRNADKIKKTCDKEGATSQDHTARAIYDGIWTGHRHVVLTDLADAFGQVPHKAVVKAMQDIGLDMAAARWVLRLVRIDAIDRNGPIRTQAGKGIEQGNQLSASVMNLVLAPVLKTAAGDGQVIAIAYLDDIYLLASTDEKARKAFGTFCQSANSRGFDNVRPLMLDGDTDSKASRIINTDVEFVPVLKTYLINRTGIALKPAKVVAAMDEKVIHQGMTIGKLRDAVGCQALTKSANRKKNAGLIRLQPMKSPDTNATVGRAVRDHRLSTGDVGLPRLGDGPDDSQLTFRLEGEQHRGFHGLGDKPDLGLDVATTGTCYYVDGDKDELHVVLYPSRDDNEPTDGVLGEPLVVSSFVAVPSLGKQAGKIPSTKARKNTEAEGRNTPCVSGRAGKFHPPDRLSLLDARVQEALQGNKGFRLGDSYKGSILDLRELDTALGAAKDNMAVVNGTVNGLVRLVRQRNRATVIFNPMSAAMASTAILGGANDKLYLREADRGLDDGSVQVVLKRVVALRSRRQGIPSAKPDAGVVVLSGTRTSRALGQYRFRLNNRDGAYNARVPVAGPSDVAGVLAGLAWALQGHRESTVAVKAIGLLHVAKLLAERTNPRLVLMHDAVEELTANWSWAVQGRYVVGVPLPLSSTKPAVMQPAVPSCLPPAVVHVTGPRVDPSSAAE